MTEAQDRSRAEFAQSRGYMSADFLLEADGIQPQEREGLIDFVRWVDSKHQLGGLPDWHFRMETAGTRCGAAGCVAGFVWHRAATEMDPVEFQQLFRPGPVTYTNYFTDEPDAGYRHCPTLHELYMMGSVSGRALSDGNDFRLEDVSEDEARDAVERVLRHQRPIWPPGLHVYAPSGALASK